MHGELERHHLAEAETHIAKARKKLVRQRALVARLQKSKAVEAADQRQKAEAVLLVMEDNIRALEGQRAFILEKLGLYELGETSDAARWLTQRRSQALE